MEETPTKEGWKDEGVEGRSVWRRGGVIPEAALIGSKEDRTSHVTILS